MNILDQIPNDVVLIHTCRCSNAPEQPADDEPDKHVFTVDGTEFPWHITERCAIVTRLTDDLYSIDVEIVLLDKGNIRRTLPFGYSPLENIPYIPVIDGRAFPWLLTADGCQLSFGHKIVPTLRLAFLARSVSTNLAVDDQRPAMSGEDIFCGGGLLVKAGAT